MVIAPGGPARTSGRAPVWTDASSGAITIAERSPARQAAFLLIVAAACLGTALGLRWTVLTRGHVPVAVACLVIVGGAFTWGFTRAWRVSLRLGDDGIVVRNLCRTYRISWPEVQCFADRSAQGLWALGIMLHDGRVVTASGTARDIRDARPETLAAARQAADRYGIPAHLTGTLVKPGSPVVAAGAWPGTAPAAGGPGAPVAPLAQHVPVLTPSWQAGAGNSRRGALIAVGAGGAALVALIVTIGMSVASAPEVPAPAASTAAASTPAASTPTGKQLSWDQLRPGDCLAGSNMGLGAGTPWPDSVTQVACTQSHEAEVFYAGSIYPHPPAYPGEKAVDDQASARCAASFAAYDGGAYTESVFSYTYVLDDTSADWSSGGNYVACVAYEPTSSGGVSGATPVSYSIKGTEM